MGGCCHEEIEKAFPELKIFIALHLCNYEGIPTYAVENGFYHLKNGFNNTKPDSEFFKGEFCDYYRINVAQFEILKNSKNTIQYGFFIQTLGILKQWKEQANKAIEILEKLSGKTFEIDSRKQNSKFPTDEEIKTENDKIAAGYYSPEKEKEREQEKIDLEIDKLMKEASDKMNMQRLELGIKIQVLQIGGKEALDNCIFYTHTKTLSFNWKSYGQISKEKYELIKEKIDLVEGVKIENKG